jgi:hypothetical protein
LLIPRSDRSCLIPTPILTRISKTNFIGTVYFKCFSYYSDSSKN